MNRDNRKSLLLSSSELIDRDSYEPAYVQLANILQRHVASGAFSPGDQLPSEAELRQAYQVSQMTIRRAINRLNDLHLVRSVQGKGTFVKRMDLRSAVFRSQEIQDLFSPSKATSVKLLRAQIISADEKIAKKLKLVVLDRAIYIKRLILTGDQPAFYHREYLIYDPSRPIIEAEMEVTSLQGLFNGTGSKILKRGDLSVEATIMDEEEANVLGKPWPTPAIRLEHVFYDFEEKPVSWGWFTCSNEFLRLTTSVGLGKGL